MKKVSIWVFLCLVVWTLTSCDTQTDPRPKVVSTIGMINDIVINIAGDKVQAKGLMGPGVDPHLYKASQGDMKVLSSASLILYNGLHLEAKMSDILDKLSAKKSTIAVTRTIPKSKLKSPPEFDGYFDPHVWFDVPLWMLATQEITKGLIALDPDNKQLYKKNEASYLNKLGILDRWIRAQINTIPKEKRILVTAHDAFGYFGRAYDFKVVALQGISTAAESGTKDIQRVAKVILENKVPTIFIESSVPVRHIQAVQAAVKAKGWEVNIGEELFTDAMGDPKTKEGTYIGMIQHNIESIVKGLR